MGVAVAVGSLAAGVLTMPRLRAQSSAPAPDTLSFEVASVKQNKSGDERALMMMQPGGRLIATNLPLRVVIRFAYQLQDFQLVGGPDWIASERFDIAAK